AKSGIAPGQVDALLLCSCTGFLCPGLSSYVAEELGLRSDVFLQDMTGLGCGAAVPLVRAAEGVVSLNPDAVVVTVAVEVCSAAFFVEDDFGVLVSTCLFGDGASAVVWSGGNGGWLVKNFQSLHLPEEREKIRFTNAAGRLRNQLDKSVPKLAARVVEKLYQMRTSEPEALVTHGGGRDVVEALENVLPVDSLDYARTVLEQYGNLSSPSVFVALEKCLESDQAFKQLWMCSFGAGFSAHSCELSLEL
ncbi:MAG: 3-oxoacyl-[acyl-carrier-protein] synthase III C-terminal domain-containing protein, partial [Rubritalea sp.]|uniref:3-oxoacyl-[acyl-carrier-protein] synthase III C-terminal domain-containing protein n=1 Tax=Rubritalea sp. TaxID=2109375 RepID=UPI003242BAF1